LAQLGSAAMLIAFLALIAMGDGILGCVHGFVPWVPPSLKLIFAIFFAPVAWLLGVSWSDCASIGELLGERLVLNEFIAFIDLGKIQSHLTPHSFTIATFALCGFANQNFNFIFDTGTLLAQAALLGTTLMRDAQSLELAQARDAAEAANRAKSAFLAQMSHELRPSLIHMLRCRRSTPGSTR